MTTTQKSHAFGGADAACVAACATSFVPPFPLLAAKSMKKYGRYCSITTPFGTGPLPGRGGAPVAHSLRLITESMYGMTEASWVARSICVFMFLATSRIFVSSTPNRSTLLSSR